MLLWWASLSPVVVTGPSLELLQVIAIGSRVSGNLTVVFHLYEENEVQTHQNRSY